MFTSGANPWNEDSRDSNGDPQDWIRRAISEWEVMTAQVIESPINNRKISRASNTENWYFNIQKWIFLPRDNCNCIFQDQVF